MSCLIYEKALIKTMVPKIPLNDLVFCDEINFIPHSYGEFLNIFFYFYQRVLLCSVMFDSF